MFYVYVLQSKKDKNLYIGYSNDLRKRVRQHKQGNVKSTKGRRPLKLIYYEAYKEKSDATKREYELKKGQWREILRARLKNSLN